MAVRRADTSEHTHHGLLQPTASGIPQFPQNAITFQTLASSLRLLRSAFFEQAADSPFGVAMRNATPGPGNSDGAVEALAADIQRRYRGHIRELIIEVVEGGLVLSGVARSYYGKQIALHEVRRTRHRVVANRMKVIRHSDDTHSESLQLDDPATTTAQ
jgi:hypothetical protein